MNWNKALNLLIVMFIIVNAMLGVANYKKHIQAYKISNEQVEMITKLLEEKGITLDCSLPKSFKPVDSLWIEPIEIELETKIRDHLIKTFLKSELPGVMITKDPNSSQEESRFIYKYDNKELRFVDNEVYYLDKNLTLEDTVIDEQQVLQVAEVFFEQLPMSESYKNVKIQHKIESYGAEVTYYEVYKGFPLFNSYVRMQVTPEGVYSAESKLVKKCEEREVARPLYPIHRVLFELIGSFDEIISKFGEYVAPIITNIELGYMIPHRDRKHLLEEEAVPMYKIELKGLEEPLFVNAYTNELKEK